MVSMAKLSVCFVVFILAGNSFGVPTIQVPTTKNNALTPDAQIDTSFNNLLRNAEWIFQHFAEIFRSTVDTSILNLQKWALNYVVRLEFINMADGSHYMFPHCGNAEREQEYKIIAIAVSKLAQNLKTMEHTDEVIRNVSVVLWSTNKVNMTSFCFTRKIRISFLREYFETTDRLFEGDQKLATEYKKQKAIATEQVKQDPKMDDSFVKVWEEESNEFDRSFLMCTYLRNQEAFRRAIVNKAFRQLGVKNFMMIFNATFHERYILTRSLIAKAESSDFESKIDQVYQEALRQATKLNYFVYGGVNCLDVLFGAIADGLASDPVLSAEISTIKKRIESSTVYNSDMFYFDFFSIV